LFLSYSGYIVNVLFIYALDGDWCKHNSNADRNTL
jgi:hypothetical protein